MRLSLPSLALLLTLSFSATLSAQNASLCSLAERAREAKARFAPPSPSLETKAATLLEAVARMNQVFEASASATRLAWREFLGVEALSRELGDPHGGRMEVLRELHTRYFGTSRGLETKAIQDVRSALGAYLGARELAAEVDLRKAYASTLEDLATRLDRLQNTVTTNDTFEIGRDLEWLERGGWAPDLVQDVRRYFFAPNAYIWVSYRYVASELKIDPVSKNSGVTDSFAGAAISGSAHTDLKMGTGLVPSENGAVIEVAGTGSTTADTVGTKRQAHVYSNSVTAIDLRKRFVINEKGVFALPAVVSARTRTQLNGVEQPGFLRSRLARRQATKLLPAAEAHAAQVAAAQIAREADEDPRLVKQIGDLNRALTDYYFAPTARLGVEPAFLRWSSSVSHLIVKGLVGNGAFHLGPMTAPPEPNPDYDLALYWHESAFTNFYESYLGGKNVTDKDIKRVIKDVTGTVPLDLRVGTHAPRWSFRLEKKRPYFLELGDDGFRFTMRIAGFRIGDKALAHKAEIRVRYHVGMDDWGPVFTREGDVQCSLPGLENRTSAPDEVRRLERFIRKKFEAVFMPRLVPDGLVPPSGGAVDKLRELQWKELRVAPGGWAVMGFRAQKKSK